MGIKEKIFRKESVASYIGQDKKLLKTLTAKDLIGMGIGSVIGSGIFILPGTVAAMHSGPAIVLSFVVAALVCSFAAMCYAEFSSALPVAGSAYSFGNIVFGEGIGWFLGWSLIAEYMLAVATVSTSWAAYFNSFIEGFGLKIPAALAGHFDPSHGTYINIVAVLIILSLGILLHRGAHTSMAFNNVMVVVKIAIIVLFLLVGAFYVKPANWTPFLPFGYSGVFTGASLVFFAFLGFDVVSAAAAEVKDPGKNMPKGIIGTLVICTALYILVALVLTGMVSYTKLNVDDPVAFALRMVNQNWMAGILSIGALAGMFTMMITMTYSSSRLIYSISRDGLLPHYFSKVNQTTHNPDRSMWLVIIIIAIMGGTFSMTQLASLVNIGTLFAFACVSLGVIPLRKHPELKQHDGYRVPFYPVLPVISFLLCCFMLSQLSVETWIAAAIWFALGITIYFTYGIHHSRLSQK